MEITRVALFGMIIFYRYYAVRNFALQVPRRAPLLCYDLWFRVKFHVYRISSFPANNIFTNLQTFRPSSSNKYNDCWEKIKSFTIRTIGIAPHQSFHQREALLQHQLNTSMNEHWKLTNERRKKSSFFVVQFYETTPLLENVIKSVTPSLLQSANSDRAWFDHKGGTAG